MKKILPLIIVFIISISGTASCQSSPDTSAVKVVSPKSNQAHLYGIVTDTINYKPMAFSSVSLIRRDSILYKHQFTNQASQFNFSSIKPDTYRLLITRPGFADYEEDMILKEGEEKNVGSIAMISKANLLREVLIKDRQAIRKKR